MFYVPPNNFYALKNPGGKTCKLTYVQIKLPADK
jgi:hypothetical protein